MYALDSFGLGVALTNTTSVIVTDGSTGQMVIVMISPSVALMDEVNATSPMTGRDFVFVSVTVHDQTGTTRVARSILTKIIPRILFLFKSSHLALILLPNALSCIEVEINIIIDHSHE
ncbi:MAG: hypothetical protein ACE5K4_02460 [Candidatus Hydrothermarchaeota archaeon]